MVTSVTSETSANCVGDEFCGVQCTASTLCCIVSSLLSIRVIYIGIPKCYVVRSTTRGHNNTTDNVSTISSLFCITYINIFTSEAVTVSTNQTFQLGTTVRRHAFSKINKVLIAASDARQRHTSHHTNIERTIIQKMNTFQGNAGCTLYYTGTS